MRLAQRLLLALAAMLLPLFGWAQSAAVGATYSTQVGNGVLLVRMGDEQIDLHHLGTDQRLSVHAFPTPGGLSGVLATGEVVSMGNVLGKPVLLLGATLLPLTRISAADYAAAESRSQRPPAAAAPAAGSSGASLGGVALLYAKSSNGYGQMKRFDFCSDGSFRYHFEELQSSQFGNGAGERNDAGTWSLNGNTLTVNFRSQGTRSYAFVVRSSTSVSLDGAVYAAERSGRCR
jgi:hypothetical protein